MKHVVRKSHSFIVAILTLLIVILKDTYVLLSVVFVEDTSTALRAVPTTGFVGSNMSVEIFSTGALVLLHGSCLLSVC